MGYNTYFQGYLSVAPPLSEEIIGKINQLKVEPPKEIEKEIRWFSILVSEAGEIEIPDSEKIYDIEEQIAYVIEKILIPNGYVANGTFLAQGEDVGDIWGIEVVDNKVVRHDEIIVAKGKKQTTVFDPSNKV